MLDNKVLDMTPGEALLEAPIGELIQRVASSIAEAQLKLDQIGVRVASLLSDARVTFNKADGRPVEKSLLELGFLPTFYAFTETDIEIKLTIQLKVDEEFKISGSATAGNGAGVEAAKRVVPFGATISADYHRKYGFDMSGSSMVKTKLLSVPPPSVFLETIKEHARSQALNNGDTPPAAPEPAPPPAAPEPPPPAPPVG
jgi:hypothetical protein